MKKLLMSVIAGFFITCFAFANTSEIKTINLEHNEITTVEVSISKIIDDDFWFCYEISRSSSINMMTGEETITITYHCTWYNL